MATPRSSKNGKAQWDGADIPHSRGWSFTPTSDNKQYASSDTAGHISRVAGHKDHSLTVRAYLDDATDIEGILREGDTGVMNLYEDDTRFWACPVIVDSIEVTTEIEGGELVEVAGITCSATAAFTPPA